MPDILLVDDDDSVRIIMRIALVKLGHVVREARDGREAMRLCKQRQPELMITDIIMPEQEGLETIRAVRRLYPEVKVVAMSGGGRADATDYLKVASALGAKAVLSKPFSTEHLAKVLDELLAKPE